MKGKIGVIFLDGAEIITGIYFLDRDLKWQKVYFQAKDFTISEPQKPIDYLDIVEALAEIFFFGIKLHIKDWKIIARNLEDEVLKKISHATKFKIKSLDLKTEQELICRGILSEV